MHPHLLQVPGLLRTYAWIFADLIDLAIDFISQALWQLLLNVLEIADGLRRVGHA